MREEKKL